MKIRLFALLFLGIAAILPLLSFGYLAITQSENATISETRRANQLLAQSTAGRIEEYLAHERSQLLTAGIAVFLAAPKQAQRIAQSYLIEHPHWHNLTIVDTTGNSRTSVPQTGYLYPDVTIDGALAGVPTFSQVRPARQDRDGPFAHSISIALPLFIVGALQGAILIDIDLVSLWRPINSIQIGEHGFVRLITAGGTVLAHGHPEERRIVFSAQSQSALLERAKAGKNIVNSLGQPAITSLAPIHGMPWFVVIEQPVAEAYSAARTIRRSLLFLIAATIVLVVAIGLLSGRRLIQSLELMETHTKTLALGDLQPVVEVPSKVQEVKSLANSINQMAKSLEHLHSEAKLKERISTFGRVAAGLAHDLRQPIETISVASQQLIQSPDDKESIEFFEWTVQNEMPRLQRYMDDMQHLATKGDVGIQALEFAPEEMVQHIVTQMASAPKWEGVSFRYTGHATLTEADQPLLSRAITNLAGNAADATIAKGEGEVTIHLENTESDLGSFLSITISDNGIGLSQDALHRVLTSDFQSSKRANGIGLGFGVARHVAQTHGGTITGVSKEGSGTSFTFSIPSRRPPTTS